MPENFPSPIKVLEIDPAKVARFKQQLRDEQRFPLAILAGGAAAGAGAVLWAIVTGVSGYNTAIMALIVGACVGYAVRIAGRGVQERFGQLGAALSVLGCLLGHALAAVIIVSRQESAPFLVVIGVMLLHPLVTLAVMATGFGALDLVFYGISLYEGYKLSFRPVTAAEKESLYRVKPGSF
jgi:hypothetical protein